jgi:hypothetical protein
MFLRGVRVPKDPLLPCTCFASCVFGKKSFGTSFTKIHKQKLAYLRSLVCHTEVIHDRASRQPNKILFDKHLSNGYPTCSGLNSVEVQPFSVSYPAESRVFISRKEKMPSGDCLQRNSIIRITCSKGFLVLLSFC